MIKHQSSRSPRFLRYAVGLALAAVATLGADTTITFQNGTNGYNGAADFSINTQYAESNGGNGIRWTGPGELGVYTVSGAGGYTVRYLLKFSNLTISPGTQVVSASVSLGFDYWDSASGNIAGYYLKNSWDARSGSLGWLHRDSANNWAAPGASSPGVDTIAGKTFVVPALRPVGNQTITIPLDKTVVQSWIDTPASNQGIMLVNNLTDNVVRIMSATGTQSRRPKLTVVIAGAGGVQVSVAPPSVTLAPGATQTFTAAVTGTSNTAVTWSATGGTITSAGVFTAGSTAGTFGVTATSVADATKSGSAQVTVQQPAPITVTVSPSSVTLQPGGTKTFTAAVTGTSNTAVTWSATGGNITSAGVFTAASTAGTFSVTATSVADTTKSGSATVTIQQPAPITVTVSPSSVTLQPGGTRTFTATVTGTTNTAVTWAATGGTIDSSGNFTAGSTAGTFSVTATSVADTTRSGSAQVSINPVISVTVAPTSASLQPGRTQQFTATVSGSTNTAVTWTATGGTISSSGLYTAGQSVGNFTVTATSAADATKSASAGVQISMVTTTLPPITRQADGPYVVVQSPASGMHFAAPGTIRIYADPYDPNAGDPDALTVTYLLNGQSAGTFTGSGARNGYFPFTVTNLAAGTYSITAQITTGGRTVTSAPATVFVDNPQASSGPVYNLTADRVLSGAQILNYVGTPGNHCAINGNGFQIRSAPGFTGTLNISYCDVRNLGTATNPSIDVTTNGTGSIQLIGNVWETFGTVSLAANDTAQLVVRNNEFRENTLVPVTNLPIAYGNETLPVVALFGDSSTQKFFQGNNVGLSTVLFDVTRNWLIGGNTDAESNVLIGVRCGFTVERSSNMVLRGNFSQHRYPRRMSQGDNFQLDGDGFLVEHNVIRDSSWPVRGMGGELRYNLIDSSSTLDQVIQAPMSNTNMHHNILTYAINQASYAPGSGVRVMYDVDNVQFNNNTLDGGGAFMGFYGAPFRVLNGSFVGSLRNNVFYNFAGLGGEPMLSGESESTNPPLLRLRYADYNDFYNPDAPNQQNYGLGVVGKTPGSAGYGMHDLGGFNGHANPKFVAPTALPFPFAPEDIWNRVKKVSDILSTYRAMYTPGNGSPLIGAGDPQDEPNINIGAVGNGEAIDQFGKFGQGTSAPPAPGIASFTANPGNISAGQSVTLSWSVTGATTLSIAPGIGTVTGTSTTVSPGATTTYTLTATNAGGVSTAAATVTVGSTPAITVSVSPPSASVATGGSRTFTATVNGTSNQSVTWTATGGTITPAGVFTAGNSAGSFNATATSVEDPTKFGTALVTITAPQPVSVSLSPTSTVLFPNGTQQFTATVANAQNPAVTWSATGGTITTGGLYTAGSSTGSFTVTATSVQDPSKSAPASITIITQTTGTHPRMFLDAPTLATLRSRAQAATAEWTRLKANCDSYVGGTAQFINGNDYIDRPNAGEGYQGSGYFDALMPLGLCYHTIRLSAPATAAKYATTAVSILMAMSDPNNQIPTECDGTPDCDVTVRDSGYGIRFFGVTMGIGYDWFHDAMTPAQLLQLRTTLNKWITRFETDPRITTYINNPSFSPVGNYLAGYYAALCYAALAVEGDDPIGDTWWTDWYTQQHLQRFAPAYASDMTGGGWLEGFAQYGILASENQSLPALAVKTAKGLDIIHDPVHPYTFPLDNAAYLMHFTWPTHDIIDDRGELYDTGDPNYWPGTTNAGIYRFYAGYLQMWGDPLAPMIHKYARDVKTALDAKGFGGTDEWRDFLFWDPQAPESDYTASTRSYLAVGQGGVAARSDWSSAATFMSFLSGPYISPQGHEHVDKGSIALERNRIPFVVNQGWLAHEPRGGEGWLLSYEDRWGNFDATNEFNTRKYHNTFQVRHLDSTGRAAEVFGEEARSRGDGARTQISRYEDGGSYTLAVGQYLEDMYRHFNGICSGQPAVTSWTREVVYLRPSQFVVYDRTGVCHSSLDQYLAFHFSANPVEVTAPGAGLHRLDVNNGQFAGSMTTILPANADLQTTSQLGPAQFGSNGANAWNKMWRTEIRPTGTPTLTNRWMTVFDLTPSSAQVAAATSVNVTAGAAVGALLQSSTGNSVVIAGTAPVGTPIAGPLSYTVPAVQTRHVITDLAPGLGYSVVLTVAGSNHTITIAQGGSINATSNGVLTFQVTPGGQVTP